MAYTAITTGLSDLSIVTRRYVYLIKFLLVLNKQTVTYCCALIHYFVLFVIKLIDDFT